MPPRFGAGAEPGWEGDEEPADTENQASSCWLLVTVSLTAGQASLRVHVWRKLRSLGSVYLQSSVCLLPDRPDTMRAVRRLLDRVHGDGGSGRLLRINLPDEDEAQDIREEFNSARDGEYAEVLERLPTLAQEITMERGRGRATYAEVEESEADLARFHTWLGKIARRDYFAAPGGEAARAAVAAVGEQLAAFEEEALNAEAPPGRPLRAVPHQRTRRTADG